MSILQEYDQIRREMGEKKYDSIETYLKTYPNILLSDILYNPKCYIDFDKWYNWKILNRTVIVNSIYDTGFGDVICNAFLCVNKIPVANIIRRYEDDELNMRCNNDSILTKEIVRVDILDDFDKYLELPKISNCSKLLQEIYDEVCESEISMCHITDDYWNEYYKNSFTERDVDNLKKEVKELGLQNVITFDDGEYKILGYGDLETKFNDDRSTERKKIIMDKIETVKKMYPIGSRIKLIYMFDDYAVPSGTIGTVDCIDDEGQIHMKWDNGSKLALNYGIDKFEKINENKKEKER